MRRLQSTSGAALLLAAQCSAQAQYVPLTQDERNRLYLRRLANPVAVVAAAAGAGISQRQKTPSEWGPGGAGYGWRIADSYGYYMVRQTLMFSASSALDEDNRYFASRRSSIRERVEYGIESTFLARRHDGSRRFSYSRIGATFGTACLSRAWQPASTRTIPNAASSFGISMAFEVGLNVAREFVPLLRR